MTKKTCLILGCGRGVGLGVAKIFEESGEFHAVICVRRTPENAPPAQSKIIQWRYFDALSAEILNRNVNEIEQEYGGIDVLIYNLGCNIGIKYLNDTKDSTLRKLLDRGVVGALTASRIVSKKMRERGRGFIGFTGATASIRAVKGQTAHAIAMYARRGLAFSLSDELSRDNIHVAHIIVDAIIDAPDTVGKMMPEMYNSKTFQDMIKNESVVQGKDVGRAYWYLYKQARSAWTTELDLRPWDAKAWWAATDDLIKPKAKM